VPPNLLINGGFEDGVAPWAGLLAPRTTDARAHTGSASLELDRGGSAVQSLMVGEFPEFLSGFYYVDAWPDDGAGWLEAIVTVRQLDPAANKQVHLVIGGIDEQPEGSTDSFVFLSRDAPATGAWTYFAYPLQDAFRRFAGGWPETWAAIDITLTYAGLPADEIALYDDVYAGPQAGNPNRPPESLD
jgi:hypothetical protein